MQSRGIVRLRLDLEEDAMIQGQDSANHLEHVCPRQARADALQIRGGKSAYFPSGTLLFRTPLHYAYVRVRDISRPSIRAGFLWEE
jgi:hypothetical protein